MKKKWFLGMVAIVFVVFLLVIVNFKNSSSFDYPPSESLVCSTEVKEYPLNTAGFPITVTNVGNILAKFISHLLKSGEMDLGIELKAHPKKTKQWSC